ncbi:MAG TPA: hypothetical protein VLV86_02115 [Vicinamibacterales bacterium]|nr:hypothetical protein [Vicinamibacterales bacterium]
MTINKTRWAAAVGAALFTLALGAVPKARGNFEKTTYLTFNKPVRLPGVALGSGTFIFELVSPENSMGTVHVLSADRKISYFLGLTTPVERPKSANAGPLVTLGESARDVAPPILAWWPLGGSTGYSFTYR